MAIPIHIEPIMDKMLARIAELDLALRLACRAIAEEESESKGWEVLRTTVDLRTATLVEMLIEQARKATQP